MDHLLKQVQNNALLWMLVFVPLVLITERLARSNHTLLFMLAILAIVPLAALLIPILKLIDRCRPNRGARLT